MVAMFSHSNQPSLRNQLIISSSNGFSVKLPILIGLILFAIGFAGLFVAGMHTTFWQLSVPFLLITLVWTLQSLP
jgi:hypothetical protein